MWLLVGGDSEIGSAAARIMRARGRPLTATTRQRDRAGPGMPFLDLAESLDGFEPPPGTTSACIFAAVARIAACDADPVGSSHINVTQTLALAERLIARGIHAVYLSTNQVFDGRAPNMPADAPRSPVSGYGKQKARTEAALEAHIARGAPVAILRLAKIISPQTALIRQWVDSLTAGQPVRAFHDMTMAPAPIDTVTATIAALMADRVSGIFQLTGPQDVSYVDVGRHIAKRLGADATLVQSGSVASAGLPHGVAPPNTTLDSSIVRERFGIAVPGPWDALDQVLPRP